MTTIMTFLLVIFWQPIPIMIWYVQSGLAAGFIYATYIAVWVMMAAATFHFGHFEFFGLTQAWQNFRDAALNSLGMTTRYLYAFVRHPYQSRLDDSSFGHTTSDSRSSCFHWSHDGLHNVGNAFRRSGSNRGTW